MDNMDGSLFGSLLPVVRDKELTFLGYFGTLLATPGYPKGTQNVHKAKEGRGYAGVPQGPPNRHGWIICLPMVRDKEISFLGYFGTVLATPGYPKGTQNVRKAKEGCGSNPSKLARDKEGSSDSSFWAVVVPQGPANRHGWIIWMQPPSNGP